MNYDQCRICNKTYKKNELKTFFIKNIGLTQHQGVKYLFCERCIQNLVVMERTTLTNQEIIKLIKAHRDFESSGGKRGKRISDLSDTRINGADFSGLNLSDLVVKNSELSNCIFTEADLNRANFDGSYLLDVGFEKTELSKSEFYECSFSNVIFNYANLTRAEISGSDMRKTLFSHAVLVGTDFDSCNVLGVDFSLSKLRNTFFHGCEMLADLKKLEGVQVK
jgi:uncharacterized protein YjbI with pentapeptide repeats